MLRGKATLPALVPRKTTHISWNQIHKLLNPTGVHPSRFVAHRKETTLCGGRIHVVGRILPSFPTLQKRSRSTLESQQVPSEKEAGKSLEEEEVVAEPQDVYVLKG